MTDLNELLERVKKATGPDKELDADILKALGFHAWAGRMSYPKPPIWVDFGGSDITASVDASLALVERRLPNTMKRVCDDDNGDPRAELVTETMGYAREHGATWPLAILAALLSALIAQEPK